MSQGKTDYAPSGPLDLVAAAICDYFNADPVWQGLRTNPAAQTRAAIKAVTPVLGTPDIQHVEDFRIPVEGGEIAVRFYRPTPKPAALIVWAHGGGFVLGSLDETDNFARALTTETGCAIATVEYRLAPEYKFPTALNDLQAATLWLAQRRNELADGEVPLILGGDSAGANLATVVTRKLHESKACAIAANILAYPCTDNADAQSLKSFQAPFLKLAEFAWFLEQYAPDKAAMSHPDFAPIHAPALDKLPPTLMITAEHDIVTGQAEAYAKRLAAAGVHIEISRHPGMIHGFLTMDAFFPSAAGKGMREIAAFITGMTA